MTTPKRGPGRPPGSGKGRTYTARLAGVALTQAQRAALDAALKLTGERESDFVREAIAIQVGPTWPNGRGEEKD